MNKILKAVITAALGISLCACSAQEEKEKGWSRTGYYQDADMNILSVTKPEEGTEGWMVGCALGEDAYSAVITQEGEALTGSLNDDLDDTGEPITVKITEEGETGLLLEVEGSEPYHFLPMKINEDVITVNISTEGVGFFNALTESDSYETNEDFTSTFAILNLEKPAEYTLSAKAGDGWVFRKWTMNGEDFSEEEEITVELTENADFTAVFSFGPEDSRNPVMNFIGDYVCDRARALVEADGTENARITIEWADSASSLGKWVMSGRFDPETLTLEYDNCVRSFVEYNESGEIANETVEYENGTGKIVFAEGPAFTWHSDSDEHGDLAFERSQTTEEPDETDEVLGHVTVLTSALNIRTAASRESASVGAAVYGKEYPVYEIVKEESLTWYRIGEDKWIGCTETYAEYKPAS
ncbi:MAG: SH3 domain-containing protein [Solobacterium sp.]|nr:SH3 domain-containing protein [Solobacterium sp.]